MVEEQTPMTKEQKEALMQTYSTDVELQEALTKRLCLNITAFKELYKIDTTALPNQTFDTYINNALFEFEVRTYESGRSTITIFKNGDLVCQNAPFNINQNLTYFTLKNECFLFLAYQDLESYNWENLGKELGLFYGSF